MTYKSLYFRLFAAMDDALTLLKSGKPNDAAALLQKALTQAEECHMETDTLSNE